MTFPLKLYILFTVTVAFFSHKVIASHVVGGNLEMVAVDKVPGRYKIALNMYFDEINQNVGGVPEATALLFVYRKSDNKRMTSFYISGISRQSIKYTNQACATLRQIKTSLYRYEGVVNWNTAEYTDSDGYYMTWQYCCRNGDIDNIRNPSQAGQTFYLEFPALSQNGKTIVNSSPVFDQVDGEYLCVNDPFRFSFDAKDADGDELRYSMEVPFDRLDPDLGVGSKNGLTVQWLPNFNVNNAIPGNPPLSINKQTGELTVSPGQLGLFVFTVVVEEYRNGTKIGLVRRDYQLFVVDCPPTTPPDPTITLNNLPTTQIQLCEGKTAELKATTNTNWEYQWKKNGNNISGAITPTLVAAESGTYQLITSLKAQCSKSRRSSDINVTVTKLRFKIKSQDPLHICGTSGIVRLTTFSGDGLTYQWYLDGNALPEMNMTLTAKQSGRYWAVVRDNIQGCTSFSDTLQITSVPLPTASITPQQATTIICAGDSLPLTTPGQLNYHYQWLLNGTSLSGAVTNTVVARQSGQYSLTVEDTTGCKRTASPYNLTVVPALSIRMDSVLRQCGVSSGVILLKGSPAGGFFAGTGVSGDKFDPAIAGVGHHRLTYTVKSSLVCQQGIAERIAVVANPTVKISPSRPVAAICADDSLLLVAQTPAGTGNYRYSWLVNGQPVAGQDKVIARQAGQYQVNIVDGDGCQAQSQRYSLTITPTIHITMNDIATFCGVNHLPVTLQGFPAGGIFSGAGVIGNQFDPSLAGTGSHSIHYTVSSSFACQNGDVSVIAQVRALPNASLGPDLEIWRGSTVQLHSGLGTNYRYRWTPPTGLSDINASNPDANPDKTTSYTLTIQDSYGCTSTGHIVVNVYERIWIPDAFSPNGDGSNDSWELRGIDSYPQAEVTVFDRWGEIVFFSNQYKTPFNGKFQNMLLPTGVYHYQIKPSPTQNNLQGTLTLLR